MGYETTVFLIEDMRFNPWLSKSELLDYYNGFDVSILDMIADPDQGTMLDPFDGIANDSTLR